MTEYVEISSARRNRVLYPNPSFFSTQFLGSSTSQDTVALSTTVYPPPNADANILYHTSVYGGLSSHSDPFNIDCLPLIVYNGINASSMPLLGHARAYIGNVIELVHDSLTGLQHEFRNITDLQIIDDGFSFTTTIASVSSQTAFQINTSTIQLPDILVGWKGTFKTTTVSALSGKTFEVHAYRAFDKTVFLSIPTSAIITSGDTIVFTTPIIRITLDMPYSQTLNPLSTAHMSLTAYTTFRIRAERPKQQTSVVTSTPQTVQAPFSTSMIDTWIWVTSPLLLYQGVALAFGTSSVQLSGTSLLDDLYGASLLVTSGAYTGTQYIIRTWNPLSEIATISPAWSASGGTPTPGDTIEIRWFSPSVYARVSSYQSSTTTAIVSPPFHYTLYNETTLESIALSPQTNIDVLQTSYQNYVPIRFTNSLVTQQQAVCHEIELLQCTIPNVLVKGSLGGFLMEYPYVYIQFRSTSSSPYEIQSNDPASTYMLFRAMIDTSSLQTINRTLQNPAFLTLTGNRMKQIVKFSVNDTYSFGIFLPDGTQLNIGEDYGPPAPPNGRLQITALFSVTRL